MRLRDSETQRGARTRAELVPERRMRYCLILQSRSMCPADRPSARGQHQEVSTATAAKLEACVSVTETNSSTNRERETTVCRNTAIDMETYGNGETDR